MYYYVGFIQAHHQKFVTQNHTVQFCLYNTVNWMFVPYGLREPTDTRTPGVPVPYWYLSILYRTSTLQFLFHEIPLYNTDYYRIQMALGYVKLMIIFFSVLVTK